MIVFAVCGYLLTQSVGTFFFRYLNFVSFYFFVGIYVCVEIIKGEMFTKEKIIIHK